MNKFIEILKYLPAVEAVPTLIFCKLASAARMLKTKSSNDVSISSWIVLTFVSYLYIAYAILIVEEWQYTLACILASVGSTLNTVIAIYFRRKGNKKDVKE